MHLRLCEFRKSEITPASCLRAATRRNLSQKPVALEIRFSRSPVQRVFRTSEGFGCSQRLAVCTGRISASPTIRPSRGHLDPRFRPRFRRLKVESRGFAHVRKHLENGVSHTTISGLCSQTPSTVISPATMVVRIERQTACSYLDATTMFRSGTRKGSSSTRGVRSTIWTSTLQVESSPVDARSLERTSNFVRRSGVSLRRTSIPRGLAAR